MALFGFDAANTLFLALALVGAALLLIAVLLDDLLGGALDSVGIQVDIGGASLMPILLAFVAMFGVGGLIGTQVLGLGNGPATLVGLLSGIAGSAIVVVVFNFLKQSESPSAFSLHDLVGKSARVAVGIRARGFGSVYVDAAGTSQEITATADRDIASGETVEVAGVAGAALIVRAGGS